MRDTLTLKMQDFASDEMIEFRNQYLRESRKKLSASAIVSSFHIAISIDETIVAYARITWGEDAPVQMNPLVSELLDRAQIELPADLIDGVVKPEFRKLGLYNLLAAMAVRAGRKVGKSHLVLSASSANGLTPVMRSWPVLEANMEGMNPYSKDRLDLFAVPLTEAQVALTLPLEAAQLSRLEAAGYSLPESRAKDDSSASGRKSSVNDDYRTS